MLIIEVILGLTPLSSRCFNVIHQNVDSGLCVAMGTAQGQALVQQQACDVTSEEQKFTCDGNKITPVKDSGVCVTASGKN